jgi:hypothetical protein
MNRDLRWFKSSYSGTEGGNCLEAAFAWCKSSHGDSEGGNCAEAVSCPHTIHVRDSKLGARSPRFAVAREARGAFVAFACTGA